MEKPEGCIVPLTANEVAADQLRIISRETSCIIAITTWIFIFLIPINIIAVVWPFDRFIK